MLETPEWSLSQADLKDALAELCNIVGGGVKSILPGPSSLSLPKVSAGPQPPPDPHLRLAAHVCFACDGHPADVRVLMNPQEVEQK
jgi:chemotaxis protein CheX